MLHHLELSFYDYSTNDQGTFVEHKDVVDIQRLNLSDRLRVKVAKSTVIHVYELSKIGDVRLTVNEGR